MVPARTADDFERAFSTMSREGVTGLLVVSSPLTVSHPAPLAALALKYRLPGMFGTKIEVEAGGLMSYGADITDLFRRAALYIDKILKGVKPADLPVEQASKYLAGHQPEDRRGARIDDPADAIGSRRRGDRMMEIYLLRCVSSVVGP